MITSGVKTSWLKNKYGFATIIVEETDRVNNFYQLLSTRRYFIATNSTFTYWVGYVLRLQNEDVSVFVPDFNTTLIKNGEQIADTKDWILVPVKK